MDTTQDFFFLKQVSAGCHRNWGLCWVRHTDATVEQVFKLNIQHLHCGKINI